MRKDRGDRKTGERKQRAGRETVGKKIKECRREWEGGRWQGGEGREGRLAQCDIQSGDESQHKKLKAAAEISRLISIQIRHKFYMPNV